MKKLIFLLCGIICVSNDAYAMRRKNAKAAEYKNKKELRVFQQNFQNNKSMIPQKYSFHEMWFKYNALNNQKKKYVNDKLSQSFLFSFAVCPKEIRHKILTTMLDNDAESAQIFDVNPIVVVFQHYSYVKQHAPLRISNKEYSAGVLFRCSKAEIDQIRGISQPFAFIEKMIDFETTIISEKTLKTIQTMKKDITQDLKLRVVRDEYVDGCLFGPIAMCVMSGLVYPVLSLPVSIGFTCCLEGLFSVVYYHRASLDAIEVEL